MGTYSSRSVVSGDLEFRLRVVRRALGRCRVLARSLELAIAAARGRRALARCAIYFFMGGFWIFPGAMPLVRGHRRLGPEGGSPPRVRRRGKLPSRSSCM